MTKILAAALALFAPAAAYAVAPPTTGYYSITYDTTKTTATLQVAGEIRVAVSSKSLSSPRVLLNGTTGFVIIASSGTPAPTVPPGGIVLDVYGPVAIGSGTARSTFTNAGNLSLAGAISAAVGPTLANCSAGQSIGGVAGVAGGIITGTPVCVASGAGDVVTTATQTFKGANTFTSSVTYGYQGILTSTANYDAACINTVGGCLVAISSVNAQQSLWFYNLYATTVTYRVEIDLIENTGTSQIGVQFNLDTGANYATLGYCTNSAAPNPLQSSGQTSIFLADASNQVNSGITLTGGFSFRTTRAAPTKVAVFSGSTVYPNANIETCQMGGYYSGSVALNTIRIFSVSQTLTGMARLYASLIPQSSN